MMDGLKMDATSSNWNPYSRLMALSRLGVVENYESIRDKTVMIVGLGGIGSVAAEMLARCGIGKLILIDYDKVEMANMNRLFYRPSQRGLSKVEAAQQTIADINPDVQIEIHDYSVIRVDKFDHFLQRICNGGFGKNSKKVDLVLSCVDNYEARVAINSACNEADQEWMESGVSEDAISGHIQTMLPGRTACFLCAPPQIMEIGMPESNLKRDGVCAASLPTTMSLIAAMLVQNALKWMLKFGRISYFLGYSAWTDFFPRYPIRPNDQCADSKCKERQKQYSAWKIESDEKESFSGSTEVIHDENDWGIEVQGNGFGATAVDSSSFVEDTVPSQGLEELEAELRGILSKPNSD